jgi:hypothetical protein
MIVMLVLVGQTEFPSGYDDVYSTFKIVVVCISSVLPQLTGMR